MGPEQLTEDQWQALAEVADAYQNDKLSRRDALKLAGAGGIGALLGGGGAMSAVDRASAGTAQVGQIGTAADPVDVEAEDVNAASVTAADSVTVTDGEATDTLHYGSNQDRANAGNESVAVGIGARAPGVGGAGSHVAIGYQAAQNDTGDLVTASGYQAAQNNTGNWLTANGYQAAGDNTGGFVTANGYQAAGDNTGIRTTASGSQAAQKNTGDRVTAIGFRSARGDGLADPATMGDDNIGIGSSAIKDNQASGLIAIGQSAGLNAQTNDQLIITQRDGTRRMVMDLTTGDLSITGTITENATL